MVPTRQTTAKMTLRLPHGTQVVKGAAKPGGLSALSMGAYRQLFLRD
jgi:hypothetical protein